MHIGLCAGPCINGDGYDERVKTVRRVLNGDAAPLLEELVAEMEAASQTQAFELAAQHRDMIRAVRATTSQHVVSSKVYRDCDAIGIAMRATSLRSWSSTPTKASCKVRKPGRPCIGATWVKPSRCSSPNTTPTARRLACCCRPVPIFDGLQAWLDERRGRRSRCEHPSEAIWKTSPPSLGKTQRFNCNAWPTNPSGSLEQRAADEGAKRSA